MVSDYDKEKTEQQKHYEKWIDFFRRLTWEIPIRLDQKDAIAYLLYRDRMETLQHIADFCRVQSVSNEEFDKNIKEQ